MQRFISEFPCTLTPGQTGTLGDGRGFKVVEAAPGSEGRCEFLAVTNPAPAAARESAPPEDAEAAAEAGTQTIIMARQLTLPYPLPGAGS